MGCGTPADLLLPERLPEVLNQLPGIGDVRLQGDGFRVHCRGIGLARSALIPVDHHRVLFQPALVGAQVGYVRGVWAPMQPEQNGLAGVDTAQQNPLIHPTRLRQRQRPPKRALSRASVTSCLPSSGGRPPACGRCSGCGAGGATYGPEGRPGTPGRAPESPGSRGSAARSWPRRWSRRP